MKLKAFTLYILLLLTLPLSAQQIEVSGSRKAVRTSGDVGAVLLPVAGLTAVLIQKDWEGLKQGAFSALATAGVTYALKYSIRKDRPDHSDRHSFPSMHTATSFAAAAFIQRRYGWKWGLPAYVLSTYVGWSRIYGKRMGRTCRSRHRRRMLVHLHPPVCPKAPAGNQSRSRRRMYGDLCFDEVLRQSPLNSPPRGAFE